MTRERNATRGITISLIVYLPLNDDVLRNNDYSRRHFRVSLQSLLHQRNASNYDDQVAKCQLIRLAFPLVKGKTPSCSIRFNHVVVVVPISTREQANYPTADVSLARTRGVEESLSGGIARFKLHALAYENRIRKISYPILEQDAN